MSAPPIPKKRKAGRNLPAAIGVGVVALVLGYLVLSRLVGAVLPGVASHPVGVVLFLLLAAAGAVRLGASTWRWVSRANPVAYELRVDLDGSIVSVAQGRDFAALKRAEEQILRALG